MCENMSRNKFLQYLLHHQHANKYSVHIFANPFDTFGVVTANFYSRNKFMASSDIKRVYIVIYIVNGNTIMAYQIIKGPAMMINLLRKPHYCHEMGL